MPNVNVTTSSGKESSVRIRHGEAEAFINIGKAYFKTFPGILKLIEIIFGIFCMVLASPSYLAGTDWFLFVTSTSFIATLFWTFIYTFSIKGAPNLSFRWLLSESLTNGVIAVLYIFGFIVQLAVWAQNKEDLPRKENIAAGCIALFNTIAYVTSTFLLYLDSSARLEVEMEE